jgi:hypothetical protein
MSPRFDQIPSDDRGIEATFAISDGEAPSSGHDHSAERRSIGGQLDGSKIANKVRVTHAQHIVGRPRGRKHDFPPISF